ncbi:NAD-dependent epimerase/dehydratase family protein [Thalassococcus sp. CAU 1522]|uniref:NAD-dependent epimerase/dehydratase family protein n=1 Tax=Thalassococcus arenae TaxID=2851652 RepID=A0ABS6N6A1_9RHOB|nr:NAD-dependent epimerase/dehydratase family protein [Thalassococcus arenae]MBV2359553.1 NAD-dependent epimerase/dehydratase family protein [Thalassococcus arenae]
MGDVTRILLTGATGFVGRATVAAARRRGIEVTAVIRSPAPAAWAGDAEIETVRADLSDPQSVDILRSAMQNAQAVIHAAAHLGGDPAAHERDTLSGTDRVLAAMNGTETRLVLVSSITVYDTMALKLGDTLTETSPLERADTARDAYTAAKLQQEEMVRASRRPAWLIRPGAVWGPGRTWHALMGFWVSRLFVRIGGEDGELPLVHVDHLAEMLVQAALTDPRGVTALNAVDDDRPSRARFVRAHRRATGWPRLVLPIGYGFWMAMTAVLSPIARHLPGLFQVPIARARLMPLHYPNTALRAALGGADRADFETVLAQSVGDHR